MKRVLLAGVVALGAALSAPLGGGPAFAAAPNPAAAPLSRMNLDWWRARFEAKQEELRRRRPDLLLLGDSIFQNWEKNGPEPWRDFQPGWRHFYGDRNAVDLGFKGDTTASLLWRIQNGELDGVHPRAAVVLIGANNFGRVHWDADHTVRGIDAVIAELHRRQPQMQIVLLSILPSERSAWVTQNTIEANRALATRYAADPLVHYVDVTPVFERNGQLDRTQFLDSLLTPPDPLLHPTAQAQNRMAAAIEPALSRVLNTPAKSE